MTEKMVSLIAGAGRAMGLVVAADEPSHIHVVRRRRVAQGDKDGVVVARTPGDAEAEAGGRARLAVAA